MLSLFRLRGHVTGRIITNTILKSLVSLVSRNRMHVARTSLSWSNNWPKKQRDSCFTCTLNLKDPKGRLFYVRGAPHSSSPDTSIELRHWVWTYTENLQIKNYFLRSQLFGQIVWIFLFHLINFTFTLWKVLVEDLIGPGHIFLLGCIGTVSYK